jgi:asparagine synthase (glutamine-hydrolysing)
MCGIAGIVDDRRGPDVNKSELDKMLHTLHHRGPDARGVYNSGSIWIGHNRLSIIDLDERSNQPFQYENYVLTYNGEVYNYIELKHELINKGHVFNTNSDTEVVIHAYKEWGSECVKKFIGMWAFAIMDINTSKLFASRDRFGIKPFYYLWENSCLVFASEIKALKKSQYFKSDFNPAQVARYMQLGWTGYFDETFYESVSAIPPGHNLMLSDGKLEISQYYDIEVTTEYDNRSYTDKVDEFRELFFDSLRLHLRSDVKVATCLSGGIDSSAIVAGICNINPSQDYETFSIYYTGAGDVDERPFINHIVNKYHHIHPNYYQPQLDEVKEHFDKALYHQDVPPASSSFMSQYFLMKLISEKGIKVVLDGQGSDEYLGGYFHSFYRLVASYFKEFNIYQGFAELKESNKRRGGQSGVFSEFLKSSLSVFFSEQSLYGLEYRYYRPKMTNYKGSVPFNLTHKSGNKLDNFLYQLCINTSLPNLLHYEDRNSMAFSVESRVPFLDHRLVDFVFALQKSDKIYNGVTKRILRDALKEYLPVDIYNRTDKKGFVTPGIDKWKGVFKNQSNSAQVRSQLNSKIRNKNSNDISIMDWRLSCFRYWGGL